MVGEVRNWRRWAPLFFLVALLWLLPLPAGVLAGPEAQKVRVCLAQDVQVQDFNVRGKYQLLGPGGESYGQVLPGERWQAAVAGGRLQLYKDGRPVGSYGSRVFLRQSRPAVAVLGGSGSPRDMAVNEDLPVVNAGGKVSYLKAGEGSFSVIGGSGTAAVRFGGGGDLSLAVLAAGGRVHNYRGDLEFRVQGVGITVINELPLEEYLYGVVPREMPAFWPLEAQKAQAVASRSCALAMKGAYSAYGFDLMANQLSQVYGGYDGEHPNSARAVDETRGQALFCRGKPVNAYFHSSSGGFIENCQDIWRDTLEYLKAKPDPYDRNDQHYNWQAAYTHDQLVSQLKEKKNLYNKKGDPERIFSTVEDLEVVEKTSTGARAKKIKITGKDQAGKPLAVEVSNADAVRAVLGLKSALFELAKTKGQDGRLAEVKIKGSGYGHGLGMSQYGARGMANKGYSYQDILKYYYSNVEIRLSGRS